jgi:allophanate hydrolase
VCAPSSAPPGPSQPTSTSPTWNDWTTTRVTAAEILAGCDALLLPTAPRLPSIAEVAADPLGVNRELGTYTNFVNLLDMAAIAVPAGRADGNPFGVSVITRAFDDRVAYDIAGKAQL